MVCQTESELDCVMNAARPLDAGARDALLRRIGHGVARRAVAEIQRRHFLPPELATEIPHVRTALAESSLYLQERFAAEAERFRTRSLGERARMPQERETS
jgi:hypothetical protein